MPQPRTAKQGASRRPGYNASRGARRVLGVVLAGCTLLSGCEDQGRVLGDPQDRARHTLSEYDYASFEIGPASRWRKPGVYLDYAESHKVGLKSDYGMLVALLLIHPENGRSLVYDRHTDQFREPQSNDRFTSDGIAWGGSDTRPSLARCRIRHRGPIRDPNVKLVVDPGKLYRQERQQWSKAMSNHQFVKPAGHRPKP